jgi:hypothetical protein
VNDSPVLLPPFVLFRPTFHPEGFCRVDCVVDVEPTVTKFPAVPEMLKLVNVVVVPDVNVNVVG